MTFHQDASLNKAEGKTKGLSHSLSENQSLRGDDLHVKRKQLQYPAADQRRQRSDRHDTAQP
ncbi:hypothetical protein CWD84_03920 [Bacillus siamensis]|uniref:Uncharacterized protein n=1 Tax=Bacillus siamensis TaxID=659243 RepID=A0AAI8MZ14_9BACI|nr:hypothetical protein CWD84_03920 [Bacillus siamensis]